MALLGAPTGMMLFGPLTRLLLDTYGWRSATLILGGLGSNLVWAGMLLPAHRAPAYALLPPAPPGGAPAEAPSRGGGCLGLRRALREAVVDALGLDVLCNLDFLTITAGRMAYNIAYGGLMVYTVLNGLSLGLSTTQASLLTTAFGLGSLLGLGAGSLLLSAGLLSAELAVVLGGAFAAAGLLLTGLVPTFPGQVANTLVTGASIHLTVGTSCVLLKMLPFSDQRFFVVLGWSCFLSGLSSSVADVIAGHSTYRS